MIATLFTLLAASAPLPAEDAARLARGDVLVTLAPREGSGAARGTALVRIPRGWEACFAVLRAYERGAEWMPNTDSVAVTFRAPDRLRAKLVNSAMFVSFRYGIVLRFDEAGRTVRWEKDESDPGDLRVNQGAWAFEPQADGSTLLRYSFEIATGMPLPGMIEDFFLGRGLPELLTNFRDRVAARDVAAR